MRKASGVGHGRSQVALLRFAERPWRCSEPPRNATQDNDANTRCQSQEGSRLVALEKTDLCPNQSLHQKSLSYYLPSRTSVRTSVSCVAQLPATLGELFRWPKERV
jgi:hypothetical protein